MKFGLFSGFRQLTYGLSKRADGQMNLRTGPGENAKSPAQNRHAFFGNLGVNEASVVYLRSVHEAKIAKVQLKEQGQILDGFDGALTNTPGVFLALTVADCVPVYLFDPGKQVWGLAHAGWRGVAAGIVPAAVQSMRENFHSQPFDIRLVTGPAIQKCHFEVRADVLEKFKDYPHQVGKGLPFTAKGSPLPTTLDLPGIIRAQAEGFGLQSRHIEISEKCTFCEKNLYFSHRRDHSEPLQTMLAYIGFR